MGWRTVAVSVTLLAGLGIGAYVAYNPNVLSTGQQLFQSFLPGHQIAQSSIKTTKSAHKVKVISTSTTGSADSSGNVSKATGNSTTGAVQPTPLSVSTNNAPPLNPTVINGVHLPYNPFQPSDGPYPVITNKMHLWIDVSIDQQLVYLFDGNHLLYTMITSSGLDTNPNNSTPLGVYHVQPEYGKWFYNAQVSEGAQYWTSWLDNGVFLFHSVPETINHQLILKNAARLGHKASHGCFHLTIPDAKWIMTNINTGTTVVVEQAPVALLGKSIYNPSTDQQAAIAASQTADQAANGIVSSAASSTSSVANGTTAG
nr:L,D-transpeptidase [Bacilli bacterium]